MSSTHLQPTPNTPANTPNDSRTGQKTSGQVLLHHSTPIRTSRSISAQSTLRQSLFQQRHTYHTNTKCHLGLDQHPPTLHTKTYTPPTNPDQTHHHLHRRFLHRRRQTTSPPPTDSDTRPRISETFSRNAKRLGSGHFPPRLAQLFSMAQYHQNSSNTSPTTKLSFTSWKRGLQS